MSDNPWTPLYFVEPTVRWRFVTSWAVYARTHAGVHKLAGPYRSERLARRICHLIYEGYQTGHNAGRALMVKAAAA